MYQEASSHRDKAYQQGPVIPKSFVKLHHITANQWLLFWSLVRKIQTANVVCPAITLLQLVIRSLPRRGQVCRSANHYSWHPRKPCEQRQKTKPFHKCKDNVSVSYQVEHCNNKKTPPCKSITALSSLTKLITFSPIALLSYIMQGCNRAFTFFLHEGLQA